jgi:hypothetical protein
MPLAFSSLGPAFALMVTMTHGSFSETFADKGACLTALDEFQADHLANAEAANKIETAGCYSTVTGMPAEYLDDGDLPAQSFFDKARGLIEFMRQSVTAENQVLATQNYQQAMQDLGIPEGEIPMPTTGWDELSDADVDAMLATMAGLVGLDAPAQKSPGRHVTVSKSGLEKTNKDATFPFKK